MIRQPDDPGVDELARAMRQQETGALFWFCVSILAIGIVLLAWFVPVTVARAQEAGDYPGCFGWIPHQCSCTSHSCYRARPGEVIDLGNDTFRVVSTGEVINRTGWSKDGRFMVCAFRRDVELQRWFTGPGQPIKCVFPPIPAS